MKEEVTNVVASDVSESAQYDFVQVSDRLRIGSGYTPSRWASMIETMVGKPGVAATGW